MDRTASDFIAQTGDEVVASRLEVKLGTVRVWKHRNRIPRRVWPELLEAFPGLTTEHLKAMEPHSEAA